MTLQEAQEKIKTGNGLTIIVEGEAGRIAEYYQARKVIEEAVQLLQELESVGITMETTRNYKAFEDECIRDGVTFQQILQLKDILKGMTCETCRDEKTCAICDNFNIRYCSDWSRKQEGGVVAGVVYIRVLTMEKLQGWKNCEIRYVTNNGGYEILIEATKRNITLTPISMSKYFIESGRKW